MNNRMAGAVDAGFPVEEADAELEHIPAPGRGRGAPMRARWRHDADFVALARRTWPQDVLDAGPKPHNENKRIVALMRLRLRHEGWEAHQIRKGGGS